MSAAPQKHFKQAYAALCKLQSEQQPDAQLLPLQPVDPSLQRSALPPPRWSKNVGPAVRIPQEAAPIESEEGVSYYDYHSSPRIRLRKPVRSADAVRMGAALAQSSNVHELDCSGEEVLSEEALITLSKKAWSRAIDSVTSVTLDHCKWPSSAYPLSLMVNNTLERLSLSGAGLTAADGAMIGNALRLNTTLKVLILSHNQLVDEGVKALCAGLRDNRSLQQLSLCDNGLTDTSMHHLAVALSDRYTMPGPEAKQRAVFESAAAATATSDGSAWPYLALLGATSDASIADVEASIKSAEEQAGSLLDPAQDAADGQATVGSKADKPTAASKPSTTKKPAVAATPGKPSSGAKAAAPVATEDVKSPFLPRDALPLPPVVLRASHDDDTAVGAGPTLVSPVASASISAGTQAKSLSVSSSTASGAAPASATKKAAAVKGGKAADAEAAAVAAAAQAALDAAYADPASIFTGEGCRSLRVLDLSSNSGITDEGLRSFAEMLVTGFNTAATTATAAAGAAAASGVESKGQHDTEGSAAGSSGHIPSRLLLSLVGCSVGPFDAVTGHRMPLTTTSLHIMSADLGSARPAGSTAAEASQAAETVTQLQRQGVRVVSYSYYKHTL